MARVNKATRRQEGFWQLGLRGTFEKTTSYTLCPAQSQLSVLQDGGTLEKKLGRGGGVGKGETGATGAAGSPGQSPAPKAAALRAQRPGGQAGTPETQPG